MQRHSGQVHFLQKKILMKAIKETIFIIVTVVILAGCAIAPAQTAASIAKPTEKKTGLTSPETKKQDTTVPETAAADEEKKETGEAIVYFTVILHLEGWEDGDNRKKFEVHSTKLREYANLFEKYGAVMTLEAKEIIDGCINWEDNVLLEMQDRGHPVGIHADVGGESNSTVINIRNKVAKIKGKLSGLGIDANWTSGVASRADWVKACSDAGMDAVTCMVAYGLWALDPPLRPEWFESYETPAEGHAHYPEDATDRLHGWYTSSGSTWIQSDPSGSLLIIPSGLNLTDAYEEQQGGTTFKAEFTREDINTWEKMLPEIILAAKPGAVNTFCAVWSFGQTLDTGLLEEWLNLIDGYVKKGSISWAGVPSMIDIYSAARQ